VPEAAGPVPGAAASGGGLLLVHAHPDDEAFATGGLIARTVAEGRRVDLVTCTGGEEGEIHDPTLDYDEAFPRLREIREVELRCALDALRSGPPASAPGELHLHLLGYRDSGMMGTDSNAHAEAFWNADLDEAIGKVAAIVRAAKPAVMVTYDSNGNYGHPDHINAHRAAVGAWAAAADPSRHPEAGAPHEVAKLYEIAFNRDRWMGLMADMRERGIELPWDFGAEEGKGPDAPRPAADELNPSNADAIRQVGEQLEAGEEPGEFGVPEAEISTIVDVARFAPQKRKSMDCHRTQRQDMGWLLDLPDDLAARAISPEHFRLTRWRGRDVPAGLREASVFEGL
jgi:N-acetyl-1-D-myo-inositol-2-amino-2-deoxy-alpha-D-glucopyranoside deacetylase